MPTDELTAAVFALPEQERRGSELVADGVRRIEDMVAGKERGFSEEEYRRAIE